jgi:hypothetical protein
MRTLILWLYATAKLVVTATIAERVVGTARGGAPLLNWNS